LGVIQKWLAGTNDYRELAFSLMYGVELACADTVAELLQPYVSVSLEWQNRIADVVVHGDLSKGRRFFEIFVELIDYGVLDKYDFWDQVEPLVESHADWACEAICRYFRHGYDLSDLQEIPNPFDTIIREGHYAEDVLNTVAANEPEAFLGVVLPLLLITMEKNAVKDDRIPREDSIWRFKHYTRRHRLSEQVLHAVEVALSTLASKQPRDFVKYAQLLEKSEFETAQFLLMRAYTASGSSFADKAVIFLIDNPDRLQIGYEMDYLSGAAIELIKSASTSCSPEILGQLEKVLLDFYPDWELKRGKRARYLGTSQFDLLRAIDPSVRSARVKQRLRKWRKKFTDQSDQPKPLLPATIGGLVQSPVQNVAELSDTDWLEEIQKHNRENEIRFTDRGILGGAEQLAAELGRIAQQQPKRFAELALQFPDDTHASYFDAILNAITESPVETELHAAICTRCHELPGHPCGRSIHGAIASIADRDLPENALDIVAWYATESQNPESDELLWTDSDSKDNDILTSGINSIRGGAAISIYTLLCAKPERINYLLPTIEKMVVDPSIAVRSCVAKALLAAVNYNYDMAFGLFARLFDANDMLLSTYYVEYFVSWAIRRSFSSIEPTITHMMESNIDAVALSGARQACLAALIHKECRALAEECIASKKESHRLGAAQVFSTHLSIADYRELSEECLIRLFSDVSPGVRNTASACFDHLRDCDLLQYTELFEHFAASESIPGQTGHVFYVLEKARSRIPESVCRIIEAYLERIGQSTRDMQTGGTHDTEMAVVLLMRIYNQSTSENVRIQCLRLLDKAINLGLNHVDRLLAEYDR